jgi:hypothetical protein
VLSVNAPSVVRSCNGVETLNLLVYDCVLILLFGPRVTLWVGPRSARYGQMWAIILCIKTRVSSSGVDSVLSSPIRARPPYHDMMLVPSCTRFLTVQDDDTEEELLEGWNERFCVDDTPGSFPRVLGAMEDKCILALEEAYPGQDVPPAAAAAIRKEVWDEFQSDDGPGSSANPIDHQALVDFLARVDANQATAAAAGTPFQSETNDLGVSGKSSSDADQPPAPRWIWQNGKRVKV